MDKKDRVVNEVRKELDSTQKKLLELLVFENRKDHIIVRVPNGVISLEEIFGKVHEVCQRLGYSCQKTDTFATLEELDGILSDVKWLWQGWIPTGFVSMLVGDPGVGKSMLALDWVRILTTGGCWPLTQRNIKPSNVIWVDTEASQQLLNVRSKSLGVERAKVSIPSINGDLLAQIDLSLDEHRQHILQLVESKRPTLLVLDSLSGSHNRGENKVEEVKPVMQFLALLSRDYNLAVLTIHHLSKGYQGESPEISLYRVRGSTAITQFTRSVMAIERVDDNLTKLRLIKTNLARIHSPIAVKKENDAEENVTAVTYEEYAAPAPKKTKKENCADWVVGILKSYNGSEEGVALKSMCDMGAAYGYTRGNLYSAKELLGDRIAVTGTGNAAYWHLANDVDEESIHSIIEAKNGRKGTD